jgi:RNA polymerase sigma-70 factor (ECF subfamily)
MTTYGPNLVLVRPEVTSGQSTPLSARGDDELMLLARGGVAAAFDTLVRRYQAQVLRLAARQLGHVGAAADVAQNAFLAVYRALPRYEARDRFAPFLYRTVLNECRMAHRRQRVRGGATRADADGLTGEDAISSSAPSPEALILARERERDAVAALGRLSDKLRDVVSLRYGAGLSYGEIAETLRVPVGTVKRRLFDAMENLRSQLGTTP